MIVQLEAIYFSTNSSSVVTLRLELESHLYGLTYILPQDFEGNTHQIAIEGKDKGVRLFKSRGLAFFPCATAEIALKQGP